METGVFQSRDDFDQHGNKIKTKSSGELLISVIIPTYNGAKGILDTLHSVISQSLPRDRYEIIVVDNASTDNTARLVQEFVTTSEGHDSVQYVYEPRVGVHYARNCGALRASSRVLAYTDDDVIVDSKWLEALLSVHDEDPKIVSVGGRVLPCWKVQPPDWLHDFSAGYLSLLDLGDTVSIRIGPDIYSCNMTVLREALLNVGGFHPELTGSEYLGDGETGTLMDLLDAGWKVVYTPHAIVWHVIPASRMTMAYLIQRFKNSAAACGFSEYRKFPVPISKLILSSMSWMARAGVLGIMSQGEQFLGRRKWRLHRLRMAYYQSKANYYIRLARDREFAKMVLQKSWL
jgi:glycosyltransferase involved in cell wall biosynthesis